MIDNAPNVESATDAPPALKSTDTSVISAMKAPERGEVAAEPKTSAPEPKAKADATQPPEGTGDVEQDDAPAADAADADGKKKDRLPRWVQERLERVRRVTEAETRERMLRELQQQPPAVREPANIQPTTEREKTLEDFDFDANAFLDYKVERGIERREQQAREREAEQKQAEAVEQFKAKIDTFEERAGAGAWEDISTSPLNTDPAFMPLVDLLHGDPNDLDIAHHLATHIDEAERLLALPPLARAREVAKLAEQFGEPAQKKAPPAPLPKRVTNAPPPPKTVPSGGAAVPSDDDDSLSPAARIALWQAKRRR